MDIFGVITKIKKLDYLWGSFPCILGSFLKANVENGNISGGIPAISKTSLGYTVDAGSKVSKKANTRNWYNQVPHLTQDPTWECDTNTRKHHIQESQAFRPFPAGDRKAAMNRQECT